MDPSLRKEREAFLKKAKSQPAVEKRKLKPSSNENTSKKPKLSKPAAPKASSKHWTFVTDLLSASEQYSMRFLTYVLLFSRLMACICNVLMLILQHFILVG